jgi:hypothetical protein
LVLGIPCDDRASFDYARGGLNQWRQKMAGISPTRRMPAEVQTALNQRINAARRNALLQRSVRISSAALLRNA